MTPPTDGRWSVAALTWVSLMLVTPLNAGQSAGRSFTARLATTPGFLEAVVTVLACILVLQTLWRNRSGFSRVLRRPQLAALAAYYGLGLLAAFFSEYRLFALAYAGQALIGLGLTVVVFGNMGSQKRRPGMEIVYGACAFACALTAAVWVIQPDAVLRGQGGGQYRLGGIGLHPNQLGFLAAVLGIGGVRVALDSQSLRARIVSVLLLAVALPILVAARGRADTAGFLVGVAILLAMTGRWLWIAVGSASAVIGLILVPGLGLQVLAFLNRGLHLPNVQGRWAVWVLLINRSLATTRGWLLGEGIGTSSLVLRGALETWPNPGHGHNMLVEALHSLGIPGAGLVLIALVAIGVGVINLVIRHRNQPSADPADLLAVFAILAGVSLVEHSLAGRANVYSFVGWALAAITASNVPDRGGGSS